MQINSFLAYLCNYSRSTTKNRPKKHDFSPHPALQSNGTDFAVQNPRIDNIEKQVEQEVQLVSRLCANTYFDTICVHPIKSAYTLSKFAYSLLKMRTVKCTDKLKFMVAKQILDWGTQILLSTRLPEIQIFCTAPLVQSLFHHFHEMLIP